MKKFLRKFFVAWGGCLIGFWVWSLDSTIGYLFFTLGIIFVVGSWIAEARNKKKEKEEKQT